MLIKTIGTKTVEIIKEVSLPYYSKDGHNFYRINKDESVLSVWKTFNYASLELVLKGSTTNHLARAVEATPCSSAEFESALDTTIEFMDAQLSKVDVS